MSAQNIGGTYNLATSEWFRAAVISDPSPHQVTGSEAEVDAEMSRTEAQGGSFVWEETSRAVTPHSAQIRAMTPLELQSTALDRADFDALVAKTASTGRLFHTLGFLGIATYGDALALGCDAIVAQSASVINSKIGEKTLEYLKGAVFKRTGRHLAAHRATPAEQLLYFDDIREATVALGLPFGSFGHITQTGLDKCKTIGRALQLSPLEFEEDKRTRSLNVESEVLFRFIDFLRHRVVAPFDRAKAGGDNNPTPRQ